MNLRDLYNGWVQLSQSPRTCGRSPNLFRRLPTRSRSARGLSSGNCSDASLESSDGEGLDHLLRGLSFDHDHLAEDFPLAGLRGGLHPRLDPAQARESEDASLDHFLRRDITKAADELRAHGLLELALRGERLRESAHGRRDHGAAIEIGDLPTSPWSWPWPS